MAIRQKRRYTAAQQQEEDNGGVRGPHSALTSFLREQSISAQEIRDRHRRRMGQVEEEQEEEQEEQEEEEGEGMDEEESQIRAAARRKRADDDGDDDDDENEEDDEDDETGDSYRKATALRGGKRVCPDCEIEFFINVYTVKNNAGEFLCKNCGAEVIKERRRQSKLRNPSAVRRQKKKVAVALLDKQTAKRVQSLQNICASTIASYIDQVEALGDIGAANLSRISRILSRNRKLNSTTMKLFLFPGAKSLQLWDCSEINSDAYDLLASYSHLEDLTLNMCGQLTGDHLVRFALKMPNLKKISLNGAFLVSADKWSEFFSLVGDRLESFEVGNTHRINTQVISIMVECLAQNKRFTHLKLHKLSGLDDSVALHMLSSLDSLTSLEISYPGFDEEVCERIMDDDVMCGILDQVGPKLESLNLEGCVALTGRTVSKIGQVCSRLETLNLRLCEDITRDGIIEMCAPDSKLNSLTSLDVSRCVQLDDAAIEALCQRFAPTLVSLSINSLPLAKNLEPLLQCSVLASLDAGFVPAMNDTFVRRLCKACKNIKVVTCYGAPHVTDMLEIAGVQIIGPQQSY